MPIATKLPKVGTTIFTVMSQLAQEHEAINLGQGFPDFDPPAALCEALVEAMSQGYNQYAPMPGITPLREQIARKTMQAYGHRVAVDTEITVTSGATEAIFVAIMASVHTGEEVIVLDPCYDCYEPAIELAGAHCIHIPLRLPDFSVDWQRVREAMTPKTRMLIVNTPHNPSGAVFSSTDLDELSRIVAESGILLLADEVYEHIVFDGALHQSVLRRPELAARSFVVSSFGKTYHCTGWKLGYCIAPKPMTAEFRKVHQYLNFCTFHPAQWAFAEMLAKHPEHHQQLPSFYQHKRDRFRNLLNNSRFKLLDVPAGYFQLADYSSIRQTDDLNFCDWLVREAGVAAIPVSAFYETAPETRLVRFCFAKSDATMQKAAERLCRL